MIIRLNSCHEFNSWRISEHQLEPAEPIDWDRLDWYHPPPAAMPAELADAYIWVFVLTQENTVHARSS
jgi:hypothetical protein